MATSLHCFLGLVGVLDALGRVRDLSDTLPDLAGDALLQASLARVKTLVIHSTAFGWARTWYRWASSLALASTMLTMPPESVVFNKSTNGPAPSAAQTIPCTFPVARSKQTG